MQKSQYNFTMINSKIYIAHVYKPYQMCIYYHCELRRGKTLAICMRSNAVNSEIFAGISISRMALKDIFEKSKIRDYAIIYLYQ